MTKFNELLKEYVNKSYEELLHLASGALGVLLPAFEKIQAGESGSFVIPFICTSLAIDGKFTALEHKFLNDLLGSNIDYADAKTLVNAHYDADIMTLVNDMIDACGDEMKAALLMFCLCFTAVDETITREEAAFIALLLD